MMGGEITIVTLKNLACQVVIFPESGLAYEALLGDTLHIVGQE